MCMRVPVAFLVLSLCGCVIPASAQLQAGSVFTGQYQDPNFSVDKAALRVTKADGTIVTYPILEGQVGVNIPKPGYLSGVIVYAGTGCEEFPADFGSQYGDQKLIVLMVRGNCTFSTKIFNAQSANAAAAIIYNNMGDFLITMASDQTHDITIPAAFTYQTFGNELANYPKLNESTAIMSYASANSLRITFDSYSAEGEVSATVEFRVTVGASATTDITATPYGKYTVTGTVTGDSLVLQPPSPMVWLVEPPATTTETIVPFGFEGQFSQAFQFLSGFAMPPFSSFFDLRRTDHQCGGEVQLVETCSSTPSGFCGYGCLTATDVLGYRTFNDNGCEFGYPLLWYCEDSICEGEYLVLKPTAHESSCNPGERHSHPYVTYWPEGQPVSTLSNFETSCEPAEACQASGNTGWRMQGSYIDSGPSAGDGTNSTLTYTITTVTEGQISFTFTSVGEVFYDYLIFEWNGNPVEMFTKYAIVDTWRLASFNIPSPGLQVFKWKWMKDSLYSANADMAQIKEIVITGTGGESCTPCDAGTCSSGGVSGCRACPQGYYSGPSAATCSPCSNKKPFNSHYTTYAETTSTCHFACDFGYTLVGESCDPMNGLCYLPAGDMEFNKFDPPRLSMLQNCLNMLPLETQSATVTVQTIQQALNFYVFAGDTVMSTLLNNIAGGISLNSYPTDYAFQLAVMKAAQSANDGNFVYTPPQFYSDLSVYLPWDFSVSYVDGTPEIFISGVNNAAMTFGYRSDGGLDASSYVGFKVTTIDQVSALSAIQSFANSEIGLTGDSNIKFNAALRSLYSTFGTSTPTEGDTGAWSCSFAVRSLALCDMPSASTMTFTVESADPQCTGTCSATLDVHWTVRYSGAKDVNCTTSACMTTLLMPAAAITEETCQTFTNGGSGLNTGEPLYGPNTGPNAAQFGTQSTVDGTTLEIMEAYEDVTAYLLEQETTKTGILEIRTFDDIAPAVHSALYQMQAQGVDNILVDVRGNAYGSVCKAFELAYLLAAEATTVPSMLLDVRHSTEMNATVQAESGLGGSVIESFSAHPLFQLSPNDFVNPATDDMYNSSNWMFPGVVNGARGKFSSPVRPSCSSRDSLLQFERCPNSGQPKVTTRKVNGWTADNILILTDGLCGGPCAVFTRLMQSNQWAKTISTGGTSNTPIQTAMFAGGINTDMRRLYCQWIESGVTLSFDALAKAVFPLEGQRLNLPIAEFLTPNTVNPADLTPVVANFHVSEPPPTPGVPVGYNSLQRYVVVSEQFSSCLTDGATKPCSMANSATASETCTNGKWRSCVINTCAQYYSLMENNCIPSQDSVVCDTNPVSAGGGTALWFFGLFVGLALGVLGNRWHMKRTGTSYYADVPMTQAYGSPSASMLDSLKARRGQTNNEPLLT